MILSCRWLLAGFLAFCACTPVVGDQCTTDQQCGTTTGLICDLATQNGYCTKTPCRPGECPPEATCVDFGNSQTYCMYICTKTGDCRSGLVCRGVEACPLSGEATGTGVLKACSDEAKSFCGVAPAE